MIQETCTRVWNKVHPLVTSVSMGQKEANIKDEVKDTVGANAVGEKAAKGGILRFIFIGKSLCKLHQ